MAKQIKLDVKNLRISFRTNNGTVKAVRDISFRLNTGETLAIVGESGSGKSVTARAILGILAGNAIVEGGEILYDGKDLLKISEDDFHEIRGNRISMIFQDPMSSLNPIVRIGEQLTEAMILNGKLNQKDARDMLGKLMKQLGECVNTALVAEGENAATVKKETAAELETFKKFTYEAARREKSYNEAYDNAVSAADDIVGLRTDLRGVEEADAKRRLGEIVAECDGCFEPYLIDKNDADYKARTAELKAAAAAYGEDTKERVAAAMDAVYERLTAAVSQTKPNFFCMGYYALYNPTAPIDMSDPDAMNTKMHDFLADGFMDRFIARSAKGVEYESRRAEEARRSTLAVIDANIVAYEREKLDRAECDRAYKAMSAAVKSGIDRLAIDKDSVAYTFGSGLKAETEKYFEHVALSAKKRKKESEVVIDPEVVRDNIKVLIGRLKTDYSAVADSAPDYGARTLAIVDYIKVLASKTVYRVTKKLAEIKAIDLMEEVGIDEPRKRFTQFPFQFSGGMRQRVVIAIALAANPDILICDEPTTALDVTIQAQILELINGLKRDRQLSVIFITHDLGVVANMADDIAVMYAGKIVEFGSVDDIFYRPAHPYTWALLSSMPDLDTKETLEAIPGSPPNMINPPVGDAFAARNKYALAIDFEQQPPLFEITPTHYAATWLLHPDAPKVEPPRIVTERIERMKALEVQDNE